MEPEFLHEFEDEIFHTFARHGGDCHGLTTFRMDLFPCHGTDLILPVGRGAATIRLVVFGEPALTKDSLLLTFDVSFFWHVGW